MTKNILGKNPGHTWKSVEDVLFRAIIERKISPNILTITGFMINLLGGVLWFLERLFLPDSIGFMFWQEE